MSAPLDLWPLFARNGADFVRHVHQELLRREADQKTVEELTAGLLDGRLAKIEILGRLRFSPEGRRVGRRVPSLRWRFFLSRAYRLPVVGRLARIATALARMPRLLREMQRLEQSTHQQAATLDRLQASAIADGSSFRQVAEAAASVRTRVLRLEESLSGVADLKQLATGLERRREHDVAVADSVLSLADRLEVLEQLAPRLQAEHAKRLEALVQATSRRLDEMDGSVRRQRGDLIDQQNRLGFMLEDVRKRLALPFTAPETERLVEQADHALDSLYVAFENRFRGPREEIKERQTVFLQLLDECGAGTTERPVLDVGCGRGEWLELLRGRGLSARGVDINRAMVELCQGMGLDVALGDAIKHLRAAAPGSLGAITGFHIIEHLPFKVFVQLLDLSLRALAGGGVIVFETPNPDNLFVGSRSFYLDPTHRNPLPKEMTTMLAEARGFVRPQARALHPIGASFGAEDRGLGQQLDHLFFGPQDYALIAWRP
ncbi:MAG: methyltransferase domain-containing protein [Pseudomonadota bacterium]|nr:methyltransferase domain-containing protein [Pseudomonadota bacterium]